MRVSMIVAMSENRVIGRSGGLPWHLSADLRRFKRLTMGHHIIMGRRTYQSIGRLLPGRTSIVLTRQARYDARGALTADCLEAAFRLSGDDDEVFLIGGAAVYHRSMQFVERLYLTVVHACVAGDTRFPEIDFSDWRLADDQRHPADERNEYDYSFRIYDRIRATESA